MVEMLKFKHRNIIPKHNITNSNVTFGEPNEPKKLQIPMFDPFFW